MKVARVLICLTMMLVVGCKSDNESTAIVIPPGDLVKFQATRLKVT